MRRSRAGTIKRVTIAVCILSAVPLVTSPAISTAGESVGTRGRFIVILDPGVPPAATAQEHGRAFDASVRHVYRYALRGYEATLPIEVVDSLRADSRVSAVVEDGVVSASGQLFPNGINRVDGELSSAASGDGGGLPVDVDVAVLDGRVQGSHPDLNVSGHVDCTSGAKPDPDDYHGTMVAGIIAAKDNGIGVVGIAPGARIWSVQVLKKNGFGTIGNVMCGVDWVTGTHLDGNPANDIEVANLSLGGPGADDGDCGNTSRDALHQAICASTDAGIVYTVSAGNAARDVAVEVPAAYDEVLTVTAMADLDGRPGAKNGRRCAEDDDTFADFSNFTSTADAAHAVAAPGVCITSTTVRSNYLTGSGTSFASPHVAGMIALCIAGGDCAGLDASGIVAKIVRDAQNYNEAEPSYGFVGDPQHPVAGMSFGHLVRAADY